ncbi:NifU family protein [Spongiibacter sp.]|uniref:NifU family protein n=1 Tax=Spongiibacter sp. TaxID=2024860 RepID=UPI0035676FFA
MNTVSPTMNLDEAIDGLLAQMLDWQTEQRDLALALKTAVEDFHSEALRRFLSCLYQDPGAQDALRRAIADPMVYAVLRQHNLLKPSLEEQVLMALDEARPALMQHGGNIELVAVSPDKDVTLRLLGACDGCGSSHITMKNGVEQILRDRCQWLRHISVEAPSAAVAPATPVSIISPFEGGGGP